MYSLRNEQKMTGSAVLNPEEMRTILGMQKGEITGDHIYRMFSSSVADRHNSEILSRMAEEVKRHALIWKWYTSRDAEPGRFRIWFYYLVSRIFGITFGN